MKKHLFVIAGVIFMIIGLRAQEISFLSATAENYGLNENANKVTTKYYKIKDSIGQAIKGDMKKYSVATFSNRVITSYSTFTPDGKLKEKKIYQTEGEKVIMIKTYNSNGENISTLYFEYDTTGNIWNIKIYAETSGIKVKGATLKYNKQDNIKYFKLGTLLNLVGETSGYITLGEKSCNCSEKINLNTDGKLVGIEKYQYNDLGLLTEEKHYNSKLELTENIKYEYTYNKNGSWIKRVKIKNTIPVEITERIIE